MRYALFAGDQVHARGGWADFRGVYVDIVSVMGALNGWRRQRESNPLVWWQVVDLNSYTVIHTQDIR